MWRSSGVSDKELNRKDVGKAYFPFSCCLLGLKVCPLWDANKQKRDEGCQLGISMQFLVVACGLQGHTGLLGEPALWPVVVSDTTLLRNFHSTLTLTSSELHLRHTLALSNSFKEHKLTLSYTFSNVAHFEDISTHVGMSGIWSMIQTPGHQVFWPICLDCTCVLYRIKASKSCSKSDWWFSPNCSTVAWNCLLLPQTPSAP